MKYSECPTGAGARSCLKDPKKDDGYAHHGDVNVLTKFTVKANGLFNAGVSGIIDRP